MKRKDKDYFNVPHSVQQAIPVRRIYDDGIFETEKGVFSKTYSFSDVNYIITADDDRENMFNSYKAILNSFDSTAHTQITINKRKLNKADFSKAILIGTTGDKLDEYREEYNSILLGKASTINSIVMDKYITVSVRKKNIDEARTYFHRSMVTLSQRFSKLGSRIGEMNAVERLKVLHGFYRYGEEESYKMDLSLHRKLGHSVKDYICPDHLEFKRDHFIMSNRYGRVLFLKSYASLLEDDIIDKLTSLNVSMMLSIDSVPLNNSDAIKKAEQITLGVDTNITNWQRKQNANNNFSAIIPFDMEQQRTDMRALLSNLKTLDERMFMTTITVVMTSDTLEQLNTDTDNLKKIAEDDSCQFGTLMFQQYEGLNTVLPFGLNLLYTNRTLLTESLAAFIPFSVQDIQDKGGIYYGQNVISKNMIIADRRKLLNGNSFICGVSGSGKSFAAKNEIINILLSSDSDVLIIDPENEYGKLVQALGGEVINISSASNNHINPFDINRDYADGDKPINAKAEFILTLCAEVLGDENIGPKEKSIIDRCTTNLYKNYIKKGYNGDSPTLKDFREELQKQKEPEARDIALELELYADGNLDTFAYQTDVDINNRFVCYDIHNLGDKLKTIAMLVVLDSIMNRITANKAQKKNTFIFIDEIYLMFLHKYTAEFLYTMWKRVRKSGAFCTGITQNVGDLLQSHTASTMLANSEFIVMLNQAYEDRSTLAKMLNISNEQLPHITDVEAGHGLIKVGSALVPFENKFPADTKLYKLMTTKPTEI